MSISTELSGLEIGQPQNFRNLTIYPLFRKQPVPGPLLDYELLDEAIAAGTARVTELHEGGSVPELRLENLSSSHDGRNRAFGRDVETTFTE